MSAESKVDYIKGLLARVEDAKSRASAAESVRRHIRLNGPVAVRRGVLGILKWHNAYEQGRTKSGYDFIELDGLETAVVYEALTDVRKRHQDLARDLEREVEQS